MSASSPLPTTRLTKVSPPVTPTPATEATTSTTTSTTSTPTRIILSRKPTKSDGVTTSSELKSFIPERNDESKGQGTGISRDDCKRAFDAFDSDSSGFIDEEEFWKLVNYQGLQSTALPKMTREEAKAAFRQLDTSKDGNLSFDEFFLWMTGKIQGRNSVTTTQYVPPPQLERIKSSLQKETLLDHLQQFGMKETYFCEICFSYELKPKGYQLRTCGHEFCKECLSEYFQSKINDGQVYLRCFANSIIDGKQVACDTKIAEDDIITNVNEATREKYIRFKQNVDNPHTRQCSKCGHSQQGDPEHPKIVCEKCGWEYCYTHGDQHVGSTCGDYEKKHRAEILKNRALISKISKPCPKCQSPIQKRSGCNHMKCPQCNTAFCWLCLEIIEDTTYPEHFKATNIRSGCRGKQFERVSPAQYLLLLLVSFWALIFLAPIAGVLALALFLACFLCIVMNHDCTPSCRQLLTTLRGMYECWMGVLCYVSLCLCCIPITLLVCCASMCGVGAEGDGRDVDLEREAEREAAQQMDEELKREAFENKTEPQTQAPKGTGVGLTGDQLV